MTAEIPTSTSWSQRWKSFRFRKWLRGLISPKDTAHELALGASVGMFVAFTPLFGLHLIIIVMVAFLMQRLVRFNKAVAIATCYVNNPVTLAPFLWASYKVGAWLVPSAANELDLEKSPPSFHWDDGIHAFPRYLYEIGWPLLIGSLVLGVVSAAAVYPMTLALVSWFRRGELVASTETSVESLPLPSTVSAEDPQL